MKKIVACVLFLMFVFAAALNINAVDESQNTYHYEELNIEVRFEENSTLSEEKKQNIADILAYDLTPPESRAWCWLTGHDKVIHTVTVIEHKITPYAPRCMDNTYNVTTCEKCNYYYEELVSQSYIFCCPEE